MQYTKVSRKQDSAATPAGVYAELDHLVRLQFKASGFSFLPRQPIHSILSGRHASRLRGRGLNFEELRSYLPGDDIRNIDWKVTARTKEPYVRVYTEERDRAVWLLIDQRISMFFGSRQKMKSVTAAEVAAVSAWRVLSAGDRVGAIIFDDHHLDIIAPHRSELNVMQVLARVVEKNHALNAAASHDPNPEMLNEALRRVSALAQHDCLVGLISDGFGIDEQSTRLITRLTEHNDVISAFIYDPLEEDLTDAGHLVFSDGRDQLAVDTGNRKIREMYRQDFQQRLEQMRATSKRYAIPLLPIHTAGPVPEQIRALIGHRRSATAGRSRHQ